jgi:protocatechuate 3,4-dioxygenase beta subunit
MSDAFKHRNSPFPHPSLFAGRERLARIKGYVVHEQRTPSRELPIITPSQTIGPFFPRSLVRPGDEDLATCVPGGPRAVGEPIEIVGVVSDEDGRAAGGILVEVWAANTKGKYDHPADTSEQPLDPNFKGYGRALTGPDGSYRFVSIKPGAYPNPGYDDWLRPPHIHFSVYAAGVMHRLITQMYFPGEVLNDIDPILNGIDDLAARASLIARDEGVHAGARRFRFDIALRGKAETQFFVER